MTKFYGGTVGAGAPLLFRKKRP